MTDDIIYALTDGKIIDNTVYHLTHDKEAAEVLASMGYIIEEWHLLTLDEAVHIKALHDKVKEMQMFNDAGNVANELRCERK